MRMFLSVTTINNTLRRLCSITAPKHIFCKKFTILCVVERFGLTIFVIFSTIIGGSLDFR